MPWRPYKTIVYVDIQATQQLYASENVNELVGIFPGEPQCQNLKYEHKV